MGLVREVLIKRINNEVTDINEYLGLSIQPIPDNVSFPIELSIGLGNIPAHSSQTETISEHRFKLTISEDYPFEKPIALWLTPIFHPNIMMPEDGGNVCVRSLDNWSFGSSLLSFVKGVEQLIVDPNPASPYGTTSCVAAAKWFSQNKPKFEASVQFGDSNAKNNID